MPPSVLSLGAVLQEGPPMTLLPPTTDQKTSDNTASTFPGTKIPTRSSSESPLINRCLVANFSVGGGNGCDGNNDDDCVGLIAPIVGRISVNDQDRQHQQQEQQHEEEEEEAKRCLTDVTYHASQSSPMSSSTRRKSTTSGSPNSSTQPQSQLHARSQSQPRHSSLFLRSFWEEVEDDLFVLLNGHFERFQILQSFFFNPVWQQPQQLDLKSGQSSPSLSLMPWTASAVSKSPRTTRTTNDSNNNNNNTPIVDSSHRSLAAYMNSRISEISILRTDKNYRTMVTLMQQLSNISQSMAYLTSQRHRSYCISTGDDQNNNDDSSTDRMKLHDEHISFLASFFASTTPTTSTIRAQKVAVVDCLVKLCLVANSNDEEIKTTEKIIDSDDVISGSGNCCDLEDTLNGEDVKKEVKFSSTGTLEFPSIENETETETSEKLLRFITVRRACWPNVLRTLSDDGGSSGEERSPSTMPTATTTTTKCISSRHSSRNNEDGPTMLMALIFEIRAQCLRLQEEEHERRLRRIRRMTESSDDAAMVIAASAKLVELGIHQSSKLVERKIESAAKAAKEWVEVDDEPLILDRDAVVAMAFSDTAKRASEYARKGTAMAVGSILDVSISGLHKVSEHLMASAATDGDIDDGTHTSLTNTDQETDHDDEGARHGMCGGPLSPCERREMLKAAGKISIAALGAASLVGEAVVHTGRSVASKTAGVAAEIVSHKYGSTAGTVVKNAGDTAGNLASAASNVALIDSTVLAKHVAKNASRVHIDHEAQRAKDRIDAFEKRVTSMMSTNLGIQVGGDWVGQIESLSKSHQNDDLKEKE